MSPIEVMIIGFLCSDIYNIFHMLGIFSVCSVRHDFCGGCRDSAEEGRFCHA